ncbi:MAG TPA: orotidine-5'-phosphate decarboxylase [Patescibacteria group bacterium]|nr:orotidine-5'-phosphate decarboxylase [Patescibacteria group bacterium]
MKYEDRISATKNPTTKRLFELMVEKESNLAVAADVTNAHELIRLVQAVGDEICILKTHIDVVEDCSQDLIDTLVELKQKHHFLLFEDRKFADIGNTVQMQYARGMYHIVDWADIVNAHVVPGPGIIEGLREIGLPKGRAALLLAEMSSEGNLATGEYTKTAVEWAQQYSDFVIGFIGMKKLVDHPAFVTMTPGIQLAQGGDHLKQQYQTPEQAIAAGSDVVIVGRGIYKAQDPKAAAAEYRRISWSAYQQYAIHE